MDNPITLLAIVFFTIIYSIILFRFLRSRFGKIRKASAVVVHKQKVE